MLRHYHTSRCRTVTSGCPTEAAASCWFCSKGTLHEHRTTTRSTIGVIVYCPEKYVPNMACPKEDLPSIPCQNAHDGAEQTVLGTHWGKLHPKKPCRAMCDAQDDLSCIPDASLLITEPEHQSAEYLSQIAHHEHLPASRGHDPPAVHHGPAAQDPCNTIMQRYLPLRSPCLTAMAYLCCTNVQTCLSAPCKSLHGQHQASYAELKAID